MSNPADRSPTHVYPEFSVKYLAALADLNKFLAIHWPFWEAEFGEGFRSTSRQQMLYAQGRTSPGSIVTYRDGVRRKSNHQSGLAADVWYKYSGRLTFADPPHEILDYYAHALRAQGLNAGADWPQKDYPHGEWPEPDSSTYVKARAWLKSQGLK